MGSPILPVHAIVPFVWKKLAILGVRWDEFTPTLVWAKELRKLRGDRAKETCAQAAQDAMRLCLQQLGWNIAQKCANKKGLDTKR